MSPPLSDSRPATSAPEHFFTSDAVSTKFSDSDLAARSSISSTASNSPAPTNLTHLENYLFEEASNQLFINNVEARWMVVDNDIFLPKFRVSGDLVCRASSEVHTDVEDLLGT